MKKLAILATVAGLAACAAPDPAYQQALANVPPAARAFCQTQGQIASAAAYSPRSTLNLMSTAYYNRTVNQCMDLMIQQYGTYHAQPAITEAQLKDMVHGQIAKHGFEPVKACYVAARDQPGDDMAKLQFANSCVNRLPG